MNQKELAMKKSYLNTKVHRVANEQFVHLNVVHLLFLRLKFTFALLIFFLTPFLSKGQIPADTTRYWKVEGKTSLNFSQVSLSNWSEGGDGSVSGAFLFGILANNKKDHHTWDNNFTFEYGMTKNNNETLRKSVDQIYLSSKYGREISKYWSLAALFDFKTQSAKGYNYPNTNYISRFFAPAYMNFAPGFDYKPNGDFSLLLSPASLKLTFVLDDSLSAAGAFGVDPGNRIRSEFGGYIKMGYVKKSIVKNVDFQTRIDFFSNYIKNPQNIDINWDLKLDMKINEYLSANFGTALKYDDDIKYKDSSGVEHGARVQLKQFLGVGLSVKF